MIDIAPLLGRFHYPECDFVLYRHAEGDLLSISFTVKDSRGPGDQTQRVWTFVPPMESEKQFFDWLLWRLERISIHEVREWFEVDGDLWADPHRPLEDQV